MGGQSLQHLPAALLKQVSDWVGSQSSTKLPAWPTGTCFMAASKPHS